MTETKVNQPSSVVSRMREECAPVADLVKGGPHMRAASKKHLPKFPMESEDDYKARLKSTWLFNGTKKARDDMAGRVFERPVTLAEQEGQLFEWAQNIDLEGRDLSNFANDVFLKALECGITFVLVDAPERPGDLTRAQAAAGNYRPYMAHVDLYSVLGWQWENVNNSPTLTHFRFMERVGKENRGPFSDEMVEQVRAYFLEEGRVVIRLYQAVGNHKAFEQVGDDLITGMTEIQVAPIYTGRTAFMEASSPLADIAEVNLAHWRTQSDKSNCLHKALSPLLFFKQMSEVSEDGGSIIKSADYGFASNNDQADMKWVEISGGGVERAEKELESLEKQMQWMGVQLMTQKVGSTTATEANIEDGKSISRLRMWADNLKDGLEIAMSWMADMGGLSGADTSVNVHKDFSALSYVSLTEVREMFLAGVISAEDYIKEAKRRGVVREEQEEITEPLEDVGLSV